MIREVLERVVAGEILTRSEASELLRSIMQGDGNELEIAALLAAMRTRGEHVDEVIGAAEAMRSLAVELPDASDSTIDTCGTGGDGSNTFNISTISALVVAGAGVPVAKHGNRAASSRCGSAEVLEALGVDLDAPPDLMAQAVEEVGIGFLFARACHPAMARVAPIRSGLGIRTIFNRLGPLTNPMHVKRQVVGVAVPDQLEMMLRALIELGAKRAWVVHAEDGLDEISIAGPTRIAELKDGAITMYSVSPEDFNLQRADLSAIAVEDAKQSLAMIRGVFAGDSGPARDIVLLNAGAAIYAAGVADELAAGVALAAEVVDNGKAAETLEALIKVSNEV